MTAISCNNLSKQYPGGVLALSELTLEVEEGTVFGFLGPNGAGKSTTVRTLNGTLSATAGEFSFFGRQADGAEIRMISATLSETARMYEQLSAMENLAFFGTLYGMSVSDIRDRSRYLIERLGLEGRESDKLGTYSTGMKKRIQLARTLLHRPRILFLDEPTSGLDPEASREVTDLIRDLAVSEGTTVFLCTHNLPVAERVCDRVGFLEKGRLIASGSHEELTRGIGWEQQLELTLLSPGQKEKRTESRPIADIEDINRHLRAAMDDGNVVLESRLPQPSLEELYFAYLGVKK
ncbi:MAG: ABC transporter ATP-binding protein [Spirochaeta sp.]